MPDQKQYYAARSRNGTEDEITIYTPDDRSMLCVAFWDREDDDDPLGEHADQLKADAELIVNALNSYMDMTGLVDRAGTQDGCQDHVTGHGQVSQGSIGLRDNAPGRERSAGNGFG
jgi:hypothetical protein